MEMFKFFVATKVATEKMLLAALEMASHELNSLLHTKSIKIPIIDRLLQFLDSSGEKFRKLNTHLQNLLSRRFKY